MVPMGVLAAAISQVLGSPLHPTHASISGGAWTPALWFLASEQGAWYDPSDMSTLFQDAAGTTPVTAVEQPVGLALDKRLGLVEQEDTVTHPVIGSASGLWTHSADTVLRNGSSAGQITTQGAALAATKQYWLRFTVAGFSGDPFTMHVGGSNIGMISANGSYRFLISGTGSSTLTIIPWGGAAGHATISAISIKELPGNHASQVTGASRPVLSARKNLLTYTEQFDNAAWNKDNVTVTANAAVAPDGTTTADFVVPSVANIEHYVGKTNGAYSAGTDNVLSVYVKEAGYRYVFFYPERAGSPDLNSIFDFQTGTFVQTGAENTGHTVLDVGNGWYRLSLKAGAERTGFLIQPSPYSSGSNLQAYPGDGVSGLYVWGAQVEKGTAATTYQRVNTNTDYDTVGFPHFIRFDGVDDFLVTGSIDFTGTDKMTVVAGARKLSDTVGIFVELSGNYNANDGSFYAVAGTDNGCQWSSASRGTGTPLGDSIYGSTTATGAETIVGTWTHDIAGDQTRMRKNGAPATSSGSATGNADKGAGNFGNYPLYIGCRGGTSIPFNGNLYQLVVRGALTADLAPIESFTAEKTGVTLP